MQFQSDSIMGRFLSYVVRSAQRRRLVVVGDAQAHFDFFVGGLWGNQIIFEQKSRGGQGNFF